MALYLSLMFLNQKSAYFLFIDFDIEYFKNRFIKTNEFSFAIFLVLIITIIIHSIKVVNNNLYYFWNKHVYIFYFVFCLSFALLHANTSLLINPLWAIMQSFPFLITSFYLGYIRLSNGIKYSIALHVVWNVFISIMTLLTVAE